MTPDTAALRALVDTYVTGWYLTAAEVRALCDAADEVERLRGEVASLKAQQSELVLEVGDLTRSEQAYYDRAVTAEAERDASRTAHAALVAELRALCDDSDHGWVHRRDLLALLDRHAPTTGETP